MRVKKPQQPHYKAFNHTADLGFDVFGRTRKDLFRHAVTALFDNVTDVTAIALTEERPLTITGKDLDDLFINYLREVLYLWNGEGFLVGMVDIRKLGKNSLALIARGEPLDRAKHEILTEVKAVTYHQGAVKKTPTGWEGRFIVDV